MAKSRQPVAPLNHDAISFTPSTLLLQGDVWRLLWLPVAPPLFVALLGAAIGGMRGTEADLRRLRAAQYSYKRA